MNTSQPGMADLTQHLNMDVFSQDDQGILRSVTASGVLLSKTMIGKSEADVFPAGRRLSHITRRVMETGHAQCVVIETEQLPPRCLAITVWRDSSQRFIHGTIEDITDRLEKDRALKERESQLEWLIFHAPGALSFQDTDLRYIWRCLPKHGLDWFRDQEWEGKDDFSVHGPDNAPELISLKRHVLQSGRGMQTRIHYRLSDGSFRIVEKCIHPRTNSEGIIIGLASYTRDITDSVRQREEEIEIEQRIQSGKKLESLGLMARSIAHEFNNFLTGIIGYSELIMMDADETSSPYRDAAAIMDSALHASELIQKLYAYAGESLFELLPLPVNLFLEHIANHLSKQLPESATLDWSPCPENPIVHADRQQLEFLFDHLLRNSLESTDGLPAKMQLWCNPDWLEDTLLPGGKRPVIKIHFRDNGSGLAESTIARAFDPFFGTKFLGRGLGLAASRGIAKGHHGDIEIANAEGGGAQVTLTLPVDDVEAC